MTLRLLVVALVALLSLSSTAHGRWFDAERGIWLSRDQAGHVDGPNLYAYVRSNPIALQDPMGLVASSCPGGCAGGDIPRRQDWMSCVQKAENRVQCDACCGYDPGCMLFCAGLFPPVTPQAPGTPSPGSDVPFPGECPDSICRPNCGNGLGFATCNNNNTPCFCVCRDTLRDEFPNFPNYDRLFECVRQKEQVGVEQLRCQNGQQCWIDGLECAEAQSFGVLIICLTGVCNSYPEGSPEKAGCQTALDAAIRDARPWAEACAAGKATNKCGTPQTPRQQPPRRRR